MIITLCILLLADHLIGKPVGRLLDRLRNVNWKTQFALLWDKLKTYALKAGRVATKPILTFYYVMRDAETTTLEKALIYGAIAYIVIPSDLLPKRVMGLLGILDDDAVIAYVYNRISKKITVEITNKVEETLDNWFGAEAVVIN